MHAAAIVIQQRFWYARARWITRRRLVRKMALCGLDYALLQQVPMPMADFMRLIVFSPVLDTFSAWLRRVLHRGAASNTMAPNHTVRRVINAFLFALYGRAVIDMSRPGAEALHQSALALCPLMDRCMQGGEPAALSGLARALHTYMVAQSGWQGSNLLHFMRQLMHQAVMRMHSLLEQHLPVLTDNGYRLLAIQSVAVTGNTAAADQLMRDMPAVRVMSRASRNEFWGSNGLHTSRFVHELLIDHDFTLGMESTLPGLAAKHHTRARSATDKLLDVGAAIMWVCHKAEAIIELADAIDFVSKTSPDIPSTVDRIVCRVIAAIVPSLSTRMLGEWQQVRRSATDTEGRCLDFLLRCTLTMRNELANNEIDALRTQRFSDLTGYIAQWDRVVPVSISTRRWVHAAVLRCDERTITERLAKGDPYALLRLHDRAIISMVIPSPDVLDPTRVPDILHFDFARLCDIRHTLNALGCTDADGLHELVTAEGGIHPTSAAMTDAATSLRNVIFVCRVRHGNTVARVALEIAQSMARREPATTRSG